jgi:hypothetical protein
MLLYVVSDAGGQAEVEQLPQAGGGGGGVCRGGAAQATGTHRSLWITYPKFFYFMYISTVYIKA